MEILNFRRKVMIVILVLLFSYGVTIGTLVSAVYNHFVNWKYPGKLLKNIALSSIMSGVMVPPIILLTCHYLFTRLPKFEKYPRGFKEK